MSHILPFHLNETSTLLLKARPSTCAGGAIPSHLLRLQQCLPLLLSSSNICHCIIPFIIQTYCYFCHLKQQQHTFIDPVLLFTMFFLAPFAKSLLKELCILLSSIPFLSFSLLLTLLIF